MTAPTRLAGMGFGATLPPRWEGRIYQRATPSQAFTGPRTRAAVSREGAQGWSGEVTRPVLHLANFALPTGRGDYGTGAVETMSTADMFVALLEFGPAEVGTALFAPVGLPRPRPLDFDPAQLQRTLRGQAGFQRFCTVAGRPLCLYVVLGAHTAAGALTPQLHAVLDGIEVGAR